MKSLFSSVHSHIKHHHKKYLFGIFGGYAVVKLFLLLLGLSVVQYSYNTIFAEWTTGCTFTWQYYTWEYQTWGYLTWQELTWGYLTGCTTIPGYRTWGSLDESGNLTWQTRVEESQTDCLLTWQTLTEWYMTWYYLTWGYRTGGYLTWCTQQTGNNQTGNNQTGNNQTGNNQTGNIVTWWNGICESGDIVWGGPISWSLVRDGFPISWTYSWTDCRLSGLSLQLWDHNGQWINLTTLASWAISYTFDSRRLYSFQQSGFYNIIGNTGAGNFYLYTGMYTWTYSRFFTWYKLRLLAPDQTSLYETPTFTIDNQTPTLSWIALTSSWSATGYLNMSWVVTLMFTVSEDLSSLNVTLSGRTVTNSTVSWLTYTYTRNLNSLYAEGPLVATISFADKAWNTGAVTYVSSLIFDKTVPTVTWFVFNGYASGVYMNFIWSEPIRYVFNYRKSWWSFMTGASSDYLTGQQAGFVWMERDILYIFTLDVFDRAGNATSITGDVVWTNLWNITPNIHLVSSVTTGNTVTGTLATLASTLRVEVDKFNACKNALVYTPVELSVRNNSFIIQMPNFKKSEVKTLVNAFTLFLLDKVKHDSTITSDDITEITKKFDNFLIILKLLRDDDDTCKQNLSNYHIIQFKDALQEYNINLQ